LRIVDIHEHLDIADELVKIGWEREHLAVGDYTFSAYDKSTVGIEMKEGSDLLSSMSEQKDQNGRRQPARLGKQLQNLLNYYDHPIFMLRGDIGQLSDSSGHSRILINGVETQWNLEAVRNFILTWQLKGIIYIRTSSIQDTITRLTELIAYFSRPLHLGGLNKKAVGDERLLAFPSCVPIKCREKLLESAGNLDMISHLDIEDLIEFPDIGQTRAEAIYNFYHKENNK